MLFKRTNDLKPKISESDSRAKIILDHLLSAKPHQNIVPVLHLMVASKAGECSSSLMHFECNRPNMHVLLVL